MNMLSYFLYFFDFISHPYLAGLVVCLLAFAVLGFIMSLTGRRRYIYV